MSAENDRDREIAELKAKVESLSASAAPPKPEKAANGPSAGGGFRGGFFGCLGVAAAIVAVIIVLSAIGQCSRRAASVTAAADSSVSDASVPASAAAPGSGVTLAAFSRLHSGMTYEAAVKILGSPGEELSSSDLGGIHTVMFMWKADNGIANMNAMFQNDRLVSKSQLGLE
jgi:hypothetical protein